jgi:hypothetical protein
MVRTLSRFTLPLIFLLALGIRLYDLTDLPFDFHPTRQWRAVLIARGMYYESRPDLPAWQRDAALAQWHEEPVIEPPVMERLAAWTYHLIGSEQIWVARVYSAMFWLSAGVALILIGKETGFFGGGVLAAVYFLFLQYGMIASRAFQPDPLMVALMAWGLWAVVRWTLTSPPAPLPPGEGRRRWGRVAVAGLLIGLAIYIKTVAGIMLGAAMVGMVIGRFMDTLAHAPNQPTNKPANEQTNSRSPLTHHLSRLISDLELWLLGLLALLPTVLYSLYGLFISGFLRQQLKFRFFPEMWRDPAFYIRWVEMATGITGFTLWIAALVGVLLWRTRALRGLGVGLWVGYAAYSLTFPYHTITHDYYQLPLILIVAFGLIPIGGFLLEQLARQDNRRWVMGLLIGAVTFAVLFRVWDTRVILARKDDRDAATRWARFAEIIPPDLKVVAITQTYGYPLEYFGWVDANIWLGTSDADVRELAGISEADIAQRRTRQLEENDLFLITNFNEFDRQPDLKEYLTTHFGVFAEGEGYVIYDLRTPK